MQGRWLQRGGGFEFLQKSANRVTSTAPPPHLCHATQHRGGEAAFFTCWSFYLVKSSQAHRDLMTFKLAWLRQLFFLQ